MREPDEDVPAPDAPDGMSYVAAANEAGARSRYILYFIAILLLLTATSLRNQAWPDWMGSRVVIYQQLYRCVSAKIDKNTACADFKKSAERAGYSSNKEAAKDLLGEILATEDSADEMTVADIKARLVAFRKKDIDEFTIQIPLWGSAIDINDLWLISAVAMAFLLYLYRASIESEIRVLRHIEEKLPQLTDITLMGQVLSVLSIDDKPFYRFIERVAYFLPSLLNLSLWISDLVPPSIAVSKLYVGPWETMAEYFIETVFVACVVSVNVMCIQSQSNLRAVVGRLVKQGRNPAVML